MIFYVIVNSKVWLLLPLGVIVFHVFFLLLNNQDLFKKGFFMTIAIGHSSRETMASTPTFGICMISSGHFTIPPRVKIKEAVDYASTMVTREGVRGVAGVATITNFVS